MGRVEIALDEGGMARFDVARTPVGPENADHELVVEVRGRHPGPPRRAVFARWRLDDPSKAEAFEHSRRDLFGLRVDHIDSFVCDLLVRPTDAEGVEYVVIGAYADDAGLQQARSHPAIAGWAADHPVAAFTAHDVTGMRTGDIVVWEV